jgi:hypothetical protein
MISIEIGSIINFQFRVQTSGFSPVNSVIAFISPRFLAGQIREAMILMHKIPTMTRNEYIGLKPQASNGV